MTIPQKKEATVKIGLRVPVRIHDQLKSSAEKNARSLNSEIISRLDSADVDQKLAVLSQELTSIKTLLRELLDR